MFSIMRSLTLGLLVLHLSLFPAPAAGLRRFVSVREIQDMLLIRGIDLIDHQFRGAKTVLVVGREPSKTASTNVRLASAGGDIETGAAGAIDLDSQARGERDDQDQADARRAPQPA